MQESESLGSDIAPRPTGRKSQLGVGKEAVYKTVKWGTSLVFPCLKCPLWELDVCSHASVESEAASTPCSSPHTFMIYYDDII